MGKIQGLAKLTVLCAIIEFVLRVWGMNLSLFILENGFVEVFLWF